MNVVIQIQDREAIPVRAIPLLTYWQTMTPDALALALAGDEHYYCFESIQAHRAIGGEPLQQRWWVSNVVRPHRAPSDKLKATEISHETGLQDFHAESLKMLPAGVYVWCDEFAQAHQLHYSGTTLPLDCEGKPMQLSDSEIAKLTAAHQERIALDFSPLMTTELYAQVMDGFPSGSEQSGSASPKSEKWRLFWRAVSFDENRVKAAMSELERFPPKGISEIAFRDEKRAALLANLAQIAERKDELAVQMGVDARHASEHRFTVDEMAESRTPLDTDEAFERTCEIELANKAIDALIAERTAAPVVATAAFGGVETAKTSPVVAVGASEAVESTGPVEDGLLTNEIAVTFDGVNGWSAARWPKNLSASKWLHPARIALGAAGGASSVWNPLTLAQLMHGETKGDKAREQVMKAFNSRFTRNPALMPWREAFIEYFATHCTTD